MQPPRLRARVSSFGTALFTTCLLAITERRVQGAEEARISKKYTTTHLRAPVLARSSATRVQPPYCYTTIRPMDSISGTFLPCLAWRIFAISVDLAPGVPRTV